MSKNKINCLMPKVKNSKSQKVKGAVCKSEKFLNYILSTYPTLPPLLEKGHTPMLI
jgi:hypothetical protein